MKANKHSDGRVIRCWSKRPDNGEDYTPLVGDTGGGLFVVGQKDQTTAKMKAKTNNCGGRKYFKN